MTEFTRMGFHKSGLPREVNFPLTLAPMVGLSHCAFRQVLREYLPEGAITLWPSEMLNSRRLPNEVLSRIPEAMVLGDENFWMPQILANDPIKIEKSLDKLYAHGAQGVDINMGCPVRKALQHNYGVALMGDVEYAAKVVQDTLRFSSGPVSVKLRGAAPEERDQWLGFTKRLEEAGASWLCLHPRTADQKRRGAANWSSIKDLSENLSIPVIGNGDIQVVEDVVAMLTQTGCDMVMAGRVLTVRPWLFWQLGEKLGWPSPVGRQGQLPPQSDVEEGEEYGRSLLRLWEIMRSLFPEKMALRKFLFHVKTGSVWLLYGHELYSRVSCVKVGDQLPPLIQDFFANPQPMLKKTDLRQ